VTPTEVIAALASCRSEWQRELPRIAEDQLFYLDVATFGRDAFRALLEGRDEPWIAELFGVVERALIEGDENARELIVVGMFEAMQNANHAQGPDDLIEARLGPRSGTAWGDLIEGWTGPGVRTVAAWRAIGRAEAR
jgi:hypothetical protein